MTFLFPPLLNIFTSSVYCDLTAGRLGDTSDGVGGLYLYMRTNDRIVGLVHPPHGANHLNKPFLFCILFLVPYTFFSEKLYGSHAFFFLPSLSLSLSLFSQGPASPTSLALYKQHMYQFEGTILH